MSTAHPYKPGQPYLGPDGLRIAAQAFEAAMEEVGADTRDLPPHRARRIVARCVVREALRGHRDPSRLQDRAVTVVKRIARRTSAPR
jgi:hypothetical protein